MAKRKRVPLVVVEAIVVINGTTHHRRFTARKASTQIWDGGRARIALVDGFDDKGPVESAQFRRVEEIIRRPTKGRRP